MAKRNAATIEAMLIAEHRDYYKDAMRALIPMIMPIKNPRDIPPNYKGDKAAWLADEAWTIADAMLQRAHAGDTRDRPSHASS